MESMKTSFSLPFNSYDFFGYILPGTLFSFGFLFLFKDKIGKFVTNENIIQQITGMSAFLAILVLLGLLAILYFIGQVIGCVSHLLYDRLLVRNVIGYPFQYILDLKSRPDDSVRITYLLLVVFALQVAVVPLIYETLCRFDILTVKGGWRLCVIWLSIFGILFIASFALRFFLVLSRMSRMDSMDHYIKEAKKTSIEKDEEMMKLCEKTRRIAWYIFFPIRKLTSTDTKVTPSIREKFITRFRNQTNLNLKKQKEYNSDAYWLTYISLVKSDSRHDAKINNWLNLYGCLRNYSCVFLILTFGISFRQWICITHNQVLLPDTRFLIACLLLSLILFIRYWIIYFSYYTKYIIRAYAMENEVNINDNMRV